MASKFPKIKTLISAFLMLTISTASLGSAYAASKTYNFSTTDSTVVIEAENSNIAPKHKHKHFFILRIFIIF